MVYGYEPILKRIFVWKRQNLLIIDFTKNIRNYLNTSWNPQPSTLILIELQVVDYIESKWPPWRLEWKRILHQFSCLDFQITPSVERISLDGFNYCKGPKKAFTGWVTLSPLQLDPALSDAQKSTFVIECQRANTQQKLAQKAQSFHTCKFLYCCSL